MNTITGIASAYFDASNNRDFEVISSLIQENCTYNSDTTGLFFRKGPILTMMKGFFSRYPYLYWNITEIRELDESIIELNFTLTTKDSRGDINMKEGVERIVIEDGLIRHIEVRNVSK